MPPAFRQRIDLLATSRKTSTVASRGVDSTVNKRKCAQCGLVNFFDNEACRRCGSAMFEDAGEEPWAPQRSAAAQGAKRVAWLIGVTFAIVFAWSRSLLLTSEPIDDEQRAIVGRAILLLDQAHFEKEVAMLRHFANYRATDNWWNLYLGHRDAYAATNFPLGVVTLYGPFFTASVDDTERAVILLHEAQHLLGAGEEAALEAVWREKHRLGWTSELYARTKVYRNTREWTSAAVPSLFQCGSDRQSDCSADRAFHQQ